MEAGATISDEQRRFVRNFYKRALGLEGAASQMERPLKEYENGKPRDFEESRD